MTLMSSESPDREGSICIEGSINAGVAGLSVNVCGGTCDELKRELDRLFNECGADVLNLLKSKAIEVVKAPTTKVRDAIYWFFEEFVSNVLKFKHRK